METMKVIILPSGTIAMDLSRHPTIRTFEIENYTSCGNSIILQLDLDGIACEQLSEPGSIHEAELLPSGKIRIID